MRIEGMDPGQMVAKAESDLAGFQDMLEDVVAKLESERKSPGYIFGISKAVKSWLRYNDVSYSTTKVGSFQLSPGALRLSSINR